MNPFQNEVAAPLNSNQEQFPIFSMEYYCHVNRMSLKFQVKLYALSPSSLCKSISTPDCPYLAKYCSCGDIGATKATPTAAVPQMVNSAASVVRAPQFEQRSLTMNFTIIIALIIEQEPPTTTIPSTSETGNSCQIL